jgi:hypothetical protein
MPRKNSTAVTADLPSVNHVVEGPLRRGCIMGRTLQGEL